MRHDPGLAATPPVRYILGVERRGTPFAHPAFKLSSFSSTRIPRPRSYGGVNSNWRTASETPQPFLAAQNRQYSHWDRFAPVRLLEPAAE